MSTGTGTSEADLPGLREPVIVISSITSEAAASVASCAYTAWLDMAVPAKSNIKVWLIFFAALGLAIVFVVKLLLLMIDIVDELPKVMFKMYSGINQANYPEENLGLANKYP